MKSIPKNEFEIKIFAERYELLSDTFIDIHAVSKSLSALLPPGASVFEIGLGTGYFANELIKLGHLVEGIQPADEMLGRLKRQNPHIPIVAEQALENYQFPNKHVFIVSHSSVFLFTKHSQPFGVSGEFIERLVFQSFFAEPLIVFENLFKTLSALSPGGILFINVQNNPLPLVEVGPAEDPLTFEMLDCVYDLERELVTKHFRSTYRGATTIVEDRRFCMLHADFIRRLESFGVRHRRSRDGLWMLFERSR